MRSSGANRLKARLAAAARAPAPKCCAAGFFHAPRTGPLRHRPSDATQERPSSGAAPISLSARATVSGVRDAARCPRNRWRAPGRPEALRCAWLLQGQNGYLRPDRSPAARLDAHVEQAGGLQGRFVSARAEASTSGGSRRHAKAGRLSGLAAAAIAMDRRRRLRSTPARSPRPQLPIAASRAPKISRVGLRGAVVEEAAQRAADAAASAALNGSCPSGSSEPAGKLCASASTSRRHSTAEPRHDRAAAANSWRALIIDLQPLRGAAPHHAAPQHPTRCSACVQSSCSRRASPSSFSKAFAASLILRNPSVSRRRRKAGCSSSWAGMPTAEPAV